MDSWKKNFVEKLGKAQVQCTRRFEDAIEAHVRPTFDDMATFLRDNGFKASSPLVEDGRRSYKFELAENAYVLLLLRFTSVGEFELRSEAFVPGREPELKKAIGRVMDIDGSWARDQFRAALDRFVDLLGVNTSERVAEATPADRAVALDNEPADEELTVV